MKPNNIPLPVLPEGYKWAYNVETHSLESVKPLGDDKAAPKK